MRDHSVIIVPSSENIKIGNVACTYVSQNTCPKTCPLKKCGCYAEAGNVALHTRRLSDNDSIIRTIKREANGIMSLKGDKPLRLHIVGDAPSYKAASILAKASEVYMSKHNQPVWTYTHTKRIKREAWGKISILRSVHTLRQAESAFNSGYAVSLVVKEFKQDKLYYMGRGIKGIPCPAQTKNHITCEKCLLCARGDYLAKNRIAILFKAHGACKQKALKHAV